MRCTIRKNQQSHYVSRRVPVKKGSRLISGPFYFRRIFEFFKPKGVTGISVFAALLWEIHKKTFIVVSQFALATTWIIMQLHIMYYYEVAMILQFEDGTLIQGGDSLTSSVTTNSTISSHCSLIIVFVYSSVLISREIEIKVSAIWVCKCGGRNVV